MLCVNAHIRQNKETKDNLGIIKTFFLYSSNTAWTLVIDLTISFPYEEVTQNSMQACKKSTKIPEYEYPLSNIKNISRCLNYFKC